MYWRRPQGQEPLRACFLGGRVVIVWGEREGGGLDSRYRLNREQ